MFTITWNDTKGLKIPKGAVRHQNGYWYTDNTYGSYLNSTGFSQGIPTSGSDGRNYTGTGDTVEEALAIIRERIEAPHSKNVDKAVAKTLSAFEGASK